MRRPRSSFLLARVAALVCLGLASSAPAAATTPPVELLGPWSEAEKADVAAALARLSPRLRAFPGGPLQLERHAAPGPFGMGDGSEALPDWTDGTRRFHLYAFQEPDEPRARFRLEKLSAAQHESLWRQRAVIHAVLRRWDDALRWSRREAWKRITGWVDRFDHLLTLSATRMNRYDWAYSRARGQGSAALDLLTFAEEALVPPEDFVPDAVPVDDSLPCQEFSKLAFLQGVLAGMGLPPKPAPRCPAFERWARPDGLDHFEVLFSAPSGEHPESIFGHVLLRPVPRENDLATGPDAQPVLEIAAITPLSEHPASYLWHGITGGYVTIFGVTTLGQILKQNVEIDHRTIRRYRLALTPTETRRALQRMWELERRGYLAYYFFTENCAAQLVWFLNSVLDEGRHIDRPGELWIMPTATLDSIARVRIEGPDGVLRPLLEHIPEDYLSHEALAADAERRRHALLGEVLPGLPEALGQRWREAVRQMDSPEPEARRQGFEALPELVERTLAAKDAPARRLAVFELLKATEAVEQYATDRAESARRALDARRTRIPDSVHLPTAEELVRERQRSFQHEDPEGRALANLDRMVRLKTMLDELPRRPPTPEEAQQLARLDAAHVTFVRWTEVEGELLERHFPDSPELETSLGQRAVADSKAREGQSVRGSGYGYYSVSLGADAPASGPVTPAVILRSAMLRELLGDPRLRGFNPTAELHLLDSQVAFEPRWGLPTLQRLELDIIRFRTLGREPTFVRKGVMDWFGWGATMDVMWDERALVKKEGRLGGHVYGVLDASPACERYLALGVGALGASQMDWVIPIGFSVGPSAELLGRLPLPGHGVNALRLEAQWTPQWHLIGEGAGMWRSTLRALAELDVYVGALDYREQTLGPRIEFFAERTPRAHVERLMFSFHWSWM